MGTQLIEERDDPRRVASNLGQKAETVGAVSLLPARRNRPRGRAAEQRDEVASPHGPCASVRGLHATRSSSVVQHSKIWVPTTASGHSRPRTSKPLDRACPLRLKNGQASRRFDKSALCQQRTHAPLLKSLSASRS